MEEPALERLIGPEARALKRRAHGYGGTTLRADRLPRSVSRETTLSRDLRDPAAARGHARRCSPRAWPASSATSIWWPAP